MLAIEVELLHGTVRAAPPTDVAMTGFAGRGEWPLSPARLFAAFVAADGTEQRLRATDGTGLALLERATPPVVLASGPDDVSHDPLCERFVVVDATDKATTQGYPARKAALTRPGVRVAPRSPRLVYIYEDAEPSDHELEALRRRAARISYVGCADSPARVRVGTHAISHDAGYRWVPHEGDVGLAVPYDGYLAALEHAFQTQVAAGVSRRSWVPTEVVGYGDPDHRPPAIEGELLTLLLDRKVAGHKALHVTEALRQAVLAATGDDAPAILHGHGRDGRGYLQARYLALPFVGLPHADGDIRAVGVWLPPDADPRDAQRARAAVAQIDELFSAALGRRSCRPVQSVGRHESHTAQPRRWAGLPEGARTWQTVTPVVHERHGRVDLHEVQRWFEHAGHARPTGFRAMRMPFVLGGIRMRPSDLRPRYSTDRFAHYEFTFDHQVVGPMMVGRGRQFGLGLLAPVSGAPADRAEG